ncbi:hypothetical protein ACROYT_G018419 [Oculina patagonica]
MAAFSFAILFKSAALIACLLVAVSDGCTYKSDCEWHEVCCKSICIYGTSCVGDYCFSDSGCSIGQSCCNSRCVYGSSCVGHRCRGYSWSDDCSIGEICCNSKCVEGSSCVNRSCSSDSGCSSGESCCNSECVHGSSCVGQSCSSDSDCSKIEERCCNSECKDGYNCVGSSCSLNSDCGSDETCCKGKCQYSYDDCNNSEAVVIACSVIGSLAFLFAISVFSFYVRRRHIALSYGRMIEVESAVITATVTTTVANIQSNPPFPGQEIPPSYPCHPPLELQFEHQQHTTNPPPYHPGTTAAREQPPPYTEAPKGGSGRFDAPSPSFSSAPPVLQQH